MSSSEAESLQDEIDALAARIARQASLVRQMKKESSSDASSIASAVEELHKLKISAEELQKKQENNTPSFNRKVFDSLVLRKMFVVPSFEIHGGVKGLFDLGPPSCSLKVREDIILYIGYSCNTISLLSPNQFHCMHTYRQMLLTYGENTLSSMKICSKWSVLV
jgi:glycyl-tRNA synthetase (class II)